MSDQLNGAAAVRGRFRGGRATGYEERRAHREFWGRENGAVNDMLSDLGPGTKVLDIPVGTGRYAPIYQARKFVAVGMDVSPDMLAVAEEKVAGIGFAMALCEGDVLDIDVPDQSFDVVVCTRLLNWILPDEMTRAIAEMMRVCRRRLIVSIELGRRTSDKGNKPQDEAVFDSAVFAAGGKIEKRVGISAGYWMIQIGKA